MSQPPGAPALAHSSGRLSALGGIVGWLVAVEFVSGILQGYYTPLYTDIARFLDIPDADVNIFEAAHLMVSAMVVPIFAKLGDTRGYKRMLCVAATVAALATWGVAFAPTYATFTLAWGITGFYSAWLPLDVALIHARGRRYADGPALTNLGTGAIVAALQAGAIVGALLGGQLGVFAPHALWAVLAVPALATTGVAAIVWRWVPEAERIPGGRLDSGGAVWLSLALLALGSGLTVVRLQGLASPLAWALVAVGAGLFVPFVAHELRAPDPLIDVRAVRGTQLFPVVVTSALFGVSILGAQGPLSTFARTDPAVYGYGLGQSSIGVSLLILGYVLANATGALVYPRAARRLTARTALVGAAALLALGYLVLLVLHATVWQVLACMIVAGLGGGALVAALPAAAAAVAPAARTGVATGLTNSTKLVGGMIASAGFALALLSGSHATLAGAPGTAGSLSGYMIVWGACGATALACVAFLASTPAGSFEGRHA